MPGRRTPRRPAVRLRTAGLVTALAALLAPALTGCAGEAASATGSSTLKWTSSYFPAHWDPVVSGSGAQFRELALVYASLTRTDEKGNAVPDLARSWEYNSRGDEITFHLRSGLKFSDGEPVNGAAVKAAIERAEKQKNSALFGDLTSIESVDAKGLDAVVHLSQVDYQIPQLLGQRVLQIASPKAAKSPARLDQGPVGAGPFTVTQLIPGTKAVLKKNPDYWDAENIHIDQVELTSAPDAATVISGLQTGVYNFADIGPSQASAAEKAGLDVFVQPGFNASNISLNVNKKPFDNDKVVDAVRYAVDRQEFVDKLTFGYGETTDQPFPKGIRRLRPEVGERLPARPRQGQEVARRSGLRRGRPEARPRDPRRGPAGRDRPVAAREGRHQRRHQDRQELGDPVLRQGPDLLALLHHRARLRRTDPHRPLRPRRPPQPQLPVRGPPGSEAAIAKVRETPLDSPEYTDTLRAATRAGLESKALVFTYSQPNLIAKSKTVSACRRTPPTSTGPASPSAAPSERTTRRRTRPGRARPVGPRSSCRSSSSPRS